MLPAVPGRSRLVRGYDRLVRARECGDGTTVCPAFDRLVGSRVAVANAEAAIPPLGRLRREPFYGPLPDRGRVLCRRRRRLGARASVPARRRATTRRSSALARPFASTCSTSRWPKSTSSSRSIVRRAAGCGSSSSGRDSRRKLEARSQEQGARSVVALIELHREGRRAVLVSTGGRRSRSSTRRTEALEDARRPSRCNGLRAGRRPAPRDARRKPFCLLLATPPSSCVFASFAPSCRTS